MDLAEGVSMAVSWATLVSVAAAAWYTRILARNDNRRMQRTPLIIEPHLEASDELPPGWLWYRATVRNQAPVGAVLEVVEVGFFGQSVVTESEAFGPDDFGNRSVLIQPLPQRRRAALNRRVGPVGATWDARSLSPAATVHIGVLVRGVRSPGQVRLRWRWADTA